MMPITTAADLPAAATAAHGDAPINILMVDDQPGKLLAYQAILEELGENLIAARSAREALELLLKQDVALILIDVVMPELDGFELAEMIRSHPRFEKVAMMFVSGVQHSDLDRLRGYSAGAVDFVAVPVVPEILRAKVRVFADLHRKTRALESLNRELEERIAKRTADLAAYSARVEASEERLRLALAAAGAGAWEWRFASGEVSWSPEVFALLGRADASALELGAFIDHVHPEDRERVRALFESLPTSAGRFAIEYRLVPLGWRDAQGRWLLTTGEVVSDAAGTPVAARGIHQDVTTRKRAELELELEARRKDEFLATLAHELRNPLAPIASCVQMMRQGDLEPERREKNRLVLDRQVSHLVRLVDDLLDVSRVSRGAITLDLQPVDLAEVVRATLDAAALRQSGHTFAANVGGAGPGPLVVGDPVRLAQVVSNIIGNAMKYTPPDGRIDVTLVDGDPVELHVRDTGRGIDPRDLERVFDLFARVAPERDSQGLGIGLALARRLLELHQGSIVARSEGRGTGTEIVVRLPRMVGAAARVSAAPRVVTRSARLRVLVIDDNADAADILAILLEVDGHDVRTAYGGLAGLARGESFDPDVILLDLGMPGVDGFETARRIRATEWGRRARLVALTGWGQATDRQRTSAAGFDGHLVKPVEPDALAEQLRPSADRSA